MQRKFSFCKNMMKIVLTIIIVVGLITAAVSSCPDCCITYIRVTDTPNPIPSDTSECSRPCNLTIYELSDTEYSDDFEWYYHRVKSCSSRELLFQSGVHHVKYPLSPLSFIGIGSVIIRGEPNATIRCWEMIAVDLFTFISVPNVTIRDMHILNCSCKYFFHDYTPNGTDIPEVYHLLIEILNSTFTNSRLVYQDLAHGSKSTITRIIIKDTIIQNYSKPYYYFQIRTILDLHKVYFYNNLLPTLNDNRNFCKLFNITIQIENVNVMYNSVPFIASTSEFNVSLCVFITFTGHNNFAQNEDAIIRIPPACFDERIHCHFQRETNEVRFTATKVYITNNNMVTTDAYASPIMIGSGKIIFNNSHIVFSGNHGRVSGGIEMYPETKMVLNDNVFIEFSSNIGKDGGALFLGLGSTMIFNATESNIVLSFKNNSAQRGGAIFVEDSYSDVKSIFDLQCSTELVILNFSNNSALFGGNQIYGGWIDWYRDVHGVMKYMPKTTEEILNFESSSDSEIVSCPIRICMCKDHRPDCTITNATMEVYGYAVSLDLVAVGQRFTPVPAYVQANLKSGRSDTKRNDELWRHLWPATESLQTTCTKIVYKIYSTEEILLLEPFVDGCKSDVPKLSANDSVTAQAILLFQQLSIHLEYKNCPLGFILDKNDRNCICQALLSLLGLSCDLEASMIRRNNIEQWVGVAHEHTTSSYDGPGVLVHQYCPFDYCRTDDDSLLIRLEDQARLCSFNRSGILCGGCQTSFSRVLGSSKCKICSMNFSSFVIIFSWLLSGPMLVILLMLLDLTVTVGTINGLIFYANIIQVQHATFFTMEFSSSLPSKFIAWLNLDQGYETCLYNGLDSYTITWLQFLFPLYIWLIAVALIVSSHYSTCVSRLIGNNAVQVLATLFLITYAKLLRLIIEVFSFTTITYPDGYKKTVWLMDGNVEFLKGKHVPLFLVTILFVLFSLPYTFILVAIQFLYKISHYRVMFWVQKLKPFFDAYTGPYRANHCYWTGLLLVTRIFLLVNFSLNQSNEPTVNLFIIIVVISTLGIWLYFTGWVYKSLLNNCLEVFFLFNLSLTSVAALFELSDGSHSPAVVYTSTTTAFTLFVGIVLYHTLRRLFLSRAGARLKKLIEMVYSKRDDPSSQVNELNVEPPGKVSCTVVELTQSLLDDENHKDIQVKESL